jgi:hypothetical protein
MPGPARRTINETANRRSPGAVIANSRHLFDGRDRLRAGESPPRFPIARQGYDRAIVDEAEAVVLELDDEPPHAASVAASATAARVVANNFFMAIELLVGTSGDDQLVAVRFRDTRRLWRCPPCRVLAAVQHGCVDEQGECRDDDQRDERADDE